MAVLHLDIVEGRGRAAEDEKGWKSVDRVARVTGVTGSGTAKLRNALWTRGMPRIGSRHPTLRGMELTQRIPEFNADDTETVDVRLVYERRDVLDEPEEATVVVGTSLRQVQTNKDKDGNLIEVEFGGRKQGAMLTKDESISTIEVTRRESGSPGDKSRTYVNMLNQAGWRLDPTAPAGTWKCQYIGGPSSDGAKSFNVRHSFEHNGDGWTQEAAYTDPDTGRIPDDVCANPGSHTDAVVDVDLYETINFNRLKLA